MNASSKYAIFDNFWGANFFQDLGAMTPKKLILKKNCVIENLIMPCEHFDNF